MLARQVMAYKLWLARYRVPNFENSAFELFICGTKVAEYKCLIETEFQKINQEILAAQNDRNVWRPEPWPPGLATICSSLAYHTTQNKSNRSDRSKGTNTALKEMGAKKKVFCILYGCLFVGAAVAVVVVVVVDHKARFCFCFSFFYLLNIALASWQWFFIFKLTKERKKEKDGGRPKKGTKTGRLIWFSICQSTTTKTAATAG